MPIVIARLLLGKLLGSDDVKRRVIEALRSLAANSETTIDDEAVDIIEEAWGVVVPILIGRI